MSKCIKGMEIQVCHSNAGYYVGTKDGHGFPNCRISGYADSEEAAKVLPFTRQFGCVENEFCNGGKGCFGSVVKNLL